MPDFLLMFVGVILGLFAVSYIFVGDNWAFRITEGAYIGGVDAYALYSTLNLVRTSVITPAVGGTLFVLIPTVIGLFSFSRYTRFRWLTRYPLVVLGGIGLGLTAAATIDAELLVGITTTTGNLLGWKNPVNDAFILVSMIAALGYFTYSMRIGGIFHEAKGTGGPLTRVVGYFTRFGLIVLMACFGYLFAQLLITEGLDFVISNVIVLFKRTLDAVRLAFG